jgi:hypothetical protein
MRFDLLGRRELTPTDVHRLVFEAIGIIADTQRTLDLPICPHIEETREVLRGGEFKAESLPRNRGCYLAAEYGAFEPPATIILDSKLPFCDRPLSMPQLPSALARYCATHEVIHADDHTGGDLLLRATKRHIMRDHIDKLERGMAIIEGKRGGEYIRGYDDLACLWALQYVDMVAHYKSYTVLRHNGLPKLDFIWTGLGDNYFPPNLLKCIEDHEGIDHVFDALTEQAGEYCLIEALDESETIKKKNMDRYTV